MSLKDQDNVKNNPLVGESDNVFSKLRDCVGKVGQCDIVTNPVDEKMYKNIFIQSFDDFKKISEDKNLDFIELFKNPDDENAPTEKSNEEKPKLDFIELLKKPHEETDVNTQIKNPSNENVYSEALIYIINKLDSIEKQLENLKK